MQGVCGVCSLTKDCTRILFDMAHCLQARGQAYAGLGTLHGENLKLRTHRGKVFQTFADDLKGLEGCCGIGSTSDIDRQPRGRIYKHGEFLICLDGYIKNAEDLRHDMTVRGHSFETREDVELLGSIISEGVSQGVDLSDGIVRAFRLISGPCSFVILTDDGNLYAARDPMGMRPLVLGRSRNKWAVASESTAFTGVNGLQLERDVRPGEIVRINRDGVEILGQLKNHLRHCVFEYCYFARGNSVIDGVSVAEARHNFGAFLAKRDQETNSPALQADIVSAVLFSAWLHGEGYALASGIPFVTGFLPPQYSDRTYNITDVQRRCMVRLHKHRTIESNLRGKSIVLVDDSIRSGITMAGMIRDMRRKGAREIHVRIASPVSTRNCPWAPPPKKMEEYVAATKSVEEIRQLIGADTLSYLILDDLVESVRPIPTNHLCLDCFK